MSGSTGTLSALSLPPREAIRFFLGKVNTPSAGWSDVWQEAHNRAFMVAGAATQDLLGSFRGAIAKAAEQGTTLAEFRQDFDGIVERTGWVHNGGAGWRSRIIYETNLSMAYSAGRYAQMVEPDTLAAFPYWQYVHADGVKNPRLQHVAWNGITLRADDVWWKTHYTPNGWGCQCRIRPVSRRDLARQGKSGPDEAPPVVTVPWRRPSDGKILQVPDGIDPGFAYNVGAGFAGMPAIPGAANLVPPAGWIPRVPRGARGDVLLALDAQPASPSAFATWRELAVGEREQARPIAIGRIAPDLQRDLGLRAPSIVLSEWRWQRILGKEARVEKPVAIALADLERLPELLARPLAILRQRDNGALVYVFRPRGGAEGQLGKIVVGVDRMLRMPGGQGARSKAMIAEILSGGLVQRNNLLDPALYQLVRGEL